MKALAARILPSDDGTPGAEELGVVYFIDRALGTPNVSTQLPLVRTGLADLDTSARDAGERSGFAALTSSPFFWLNCWPRPRTFPRMPTTHSVRSAPATS